MVCAVFFDERDAQRIAEALSASDPEIAAVFAGWESAPEALSSCSDPEVAQAGSRRFRVEKMGLGELAAVLRSAGQDSGDGYLDTLALDVEQCGQEL
jgi:hypothetical protein